jgi:hypothetical protein
MTDDERLAAADLPATLVTLGDCRKAGYCAAGVQRWWPRQAMPVGFNAFVRDGLSADVFMAGGDALARRTVIRKLEREADHG